MPEDDATQNKKSDVKTVHPDSSSSMTIVIVALIGCIGTAFAAIVSTLSTSQSISQYVVDHAQSLLPYGFGLIVAVVAIVAFLVYFAVRESNIQSLRNQQKIERVESRFESEPGKAKPAWDLARVTLEVYFNKNIGQITAIFWLSVIVMAIGFGIIVWGISQSFRSSDAYAGSALSVAAGIITEFIGATFLVIYKSAIQLASSYTKTLERMNSVGMAMQILDTMPDEINSNDLKSNTKAKLVEMLVVQANGLNQQADFETKSNNK